MVQDLLRTLPLCRITLFGMRRCASCVFQQVAAHCRTRQDKEPKQDKEPGGDAGVNLVPTGKIQDCCYRDLR